MLERTPDSGDPAVDLIDRLQQSYAKTLDRLLPPGSQVVLLEYPSHWNIGDHLIWLGETKYLSRRPDLSVHYISDRFTYSHKSLARHLPRDGVVLLHGGGNFGDIYPQVQRMREAVIEQFPKNRFIQLSQTITFDDPVAAKGTAAVLGRHPDFTLLARDRQGLDLGREMLPCKVELCVDAAFMLGIQRRAHVAANQIMWIARRDGEHLHTPIPHPTGAVVFDWEDVERDPRRWRRAYRWSRVQAAGLASLRAHGGPLATRSKRLVNTFDGCSRVHADAGFRHLSHAQVLVTDRLHGHIMAVLLDLPHVLLDNADSKLGRFYETWTHSAACAHWADTPEQALELAQLLSRSQPTN